MRMDSHVYPDYVVPPSYDSLLGKVNEKFFFLCFCMFNERYFLWFTYDMAVEQLPHGCHYIPVLVFSVCVC